MPVVWGAGWPGGEDLPQLLKDPQWSLPGEYYDQISLSERSVWWDVRVVRQIENPDGSSGGIDVSPTSGTRVFLWR